MTGLAWIFIGLCVAIIIIKIATRPQSRTDTPDFRPDYPASPDFSRGEIAVADIYIAGIAYNQTTARQMFEFFDDDPESLWVEIIAEPDNPQSDKALACYWKLAKRPNSGKLGYISADDTPAVSALLQRGATIAGRFRKVEEWNSKIHAYIDVHELASDP